MTSNYPLKIKNVGDDTYMLLTKGHHDIHEFMKQVRVEGYDWPLGMPEHVWLKTVPNNMQGGSTYHHCTSKTKGAFPATFVSEAYGEEQYLNMIQWTGNNLPEVVAFTGKSPRFDKWFATWKDYEEHVRKEGNTFKLIKDSGNEIANVGDWIYRDQKGENHVITSL